MLDEVKVHKQALLDRVKENRDAHKALFLKAQEGFRARVIEEIDDMLDKAKRGEIRLLVGLTPPEDHTKEYDRAIEMLEMSTDSIIAIDHASFAQLVRNEWSWFNQATVVNSTYSSGGKLGGSR
jgi:hypothetical protein